MTVILGEVLDTIREFSEPLTVNRPDYKNTVDGYVSQTSLAVAGITGHMQPLSPRELRYVPEGDNTLEWWNVWTLAEIKLGDTITDSSGLVPTVTISKIELWKEGPFWKGQGVIVDDVRALRLAEIFTSDFSSDFL